MNGPDLTKMPPSLTATIIIALMVLTGVLEAIDSPNTLTLVAALIGMVGLQQVRTSQATSRIEHQTNGIMERRHAEMQKAMADIAARQREQSDQLAVVAARLADGDEKFDRIQARQDENRQLIEEVKRHIDQTPMCEVPTEEGVE